MLDKRAYSNRLSQTMLRHADECPMSAKLYAEAPRVESHAKARGTALHLVEERRLRLLIEQGEGSLYSLQPGEDEAQAKRQVASFTEQLVSEVRAERPDLHCTAADWDKVRVMAYHLAVANPVDPARVVAIERKFVLDVLGYEITGKVDVACITGETGEVVDYKTSLAVPSMERYEDSFQHKLYGLLLMFGQPVSKAPCSVKGCAYWAGDPERDCQPCRRTGYVERRDPCMGTHLGWVKCRELYPRYLREDGTLAGQEHTLTRTDLNDFRQDLEALVARVDEAVRSGDWSAVPGSHCFGGETRFITDEGIKTLAEAYAQDRGVRVLNRHGRWESATVKHFGKQALLRVTFDDGTSVRATPDHRWWKMKKDTTNGGWLQTDERVITRDVDRVPLTRHAILPDLNEEGIRHGFTFGDGWRRKGRPSCCVKFAPQDEHMARFFSGVRRRKDGWLHAGGLPGHFKDLPLGEATPEYARGFIAGLLAADGHVCNGGNVGLFCEGREKAERIAEVARLGGCVVHSVRLVSDKPTNFSPAGATSRELMRIGIKPATAPVLRPDHAKRLNGRNQMRRMYREVVSVVPAGVEDVYCAVVPDSESFTLANGVATSNCFTCPDVSQCPLPPQHRGPRGSQEGLPVDVPGVTAENAAELGVRWHFLSEHATAIKKALRAWSAESGEPVRFGRDLELSFGQDRQFRRRRLKASELRAEKSARALTADEKWGEDAPWTSEELG